MKKNLTRTIILTLALSLLPAVFAGCGTAEDITTVKVGITGDLVEPWQVVSEKLKDQGVEIEVVEFADYVTPNKALNDGEIDLNAFQHYAFLDNEVLENGYEIQAIGETVLGPMRIFSDNLTSLDQIEAGGKIAVPNDVTNGGRALKLLETVGLIKVDEAAGYTPTLKDITENSLNLDIIEVDASTLASLLPDLSAAVINNNFALYAGLDPETALFQEDAQAVGGNPYINVIAARNEDADNEIYKKIVDAYRSDEVEEILIETHGEVYVPMW